MNETNTEKQLTRIADALEGLREIMQNMDSMMLAASVEWKKENTARKDKR